MFIPSFVIFVVALVPLFLPSAIVSRRESCSSLHPSVNFPCLMWNWSRTLLTSPGTWRGQSAAGRRLEKLKGDFASLQKDTREEWKQGVLGQNTLLLLCHSMALNLLMRPTRLESGFAHSSISPEVWYQATHNQHVHSSLYLKPLTRHSGSFLPKSHLFEFLIILIFPELQRCMKDYCLSAYLVM